MVSISGINTNIGIALSQTSDNYGTAEAVTEKLIVDSISWNENAEELEDIGIGSGGIMSPDSQRGNVAGTIEISGKVGYDNGFPLLVAQMLGTAPAPTEVTVSQGDYLHEITAANTINDVFLTVAIESSSTTVIEFPSVTLQEITMTAEDPASYVTYTASGFFNELIDTSPTNNNAAIQAVTLTNTERTIVTDADEYLQNAQGGAGLASPGDQLAITSFSFTMTRPMEFRNVIQGAAGNTVPLSTNLMSANMQLTIPEKVANTYEAAAQAGTEYKASIDVQGTQIGTGTNHTVKLNIPRMLIIQTPEYALSSPGVNPETISFKCLEATTNPTGMTDTTPYFEITNQTSTAYIT